MKSISVRMGALFFIFGFLLFCTLEARSADWRHYGTVDGIGQFFYDKDSVTLMPDSVVQVRERTIKDEDLKKALEEKKGAMQKFIEKKLSGRKSVPKEEIEKIYEEWQKEFLRDLVISEKRMLLELKCGEKRFRLVAGIELDEKGNPQKGFSASEAEWLPVDPETPVGGLYNTVCPKPK